MIGLLYGLRIFALLFPEVCLERIWAGVNTALVTAAAISTAVADNAAVIVASIIVIGIITCFVSCGSNVVTFGGFWYFLTRRWCFLTRLYGFSSYLVVTDFGTKAAGSSFTSTFGS